MREFYQGQRVAFTSTSRGKMVEHMGRRDGSERAVERDYGSLRIISSRKRPCMGTE